VNASTAPPHDRLELVLAKPALGWFPKPTVVLNGRGQPAQWGSGTWRLDPGRSGTISVYLFNRLWKYGRAEYVLGTEPPNVLVYSAPWLPFLRGKLRAEVPSRG
jgi:hypothetical protein